MVKFDDLDGQNVFEKLFFPNQGKTVLSLSEAQNPKALFLNAIGSLFINQSIFQIPGIYFQYEPSNVCVLES